MAENMDGSLASERPRRRRVGYDHTNWHRMSESACDDEVSPFLEEGRLRASSLNYDYKLKPQNWFLDPESSRSQQSVSSQDDWQQDSTMSYEEQPQKLRVSYRETPHGLVASYSTPPQKLSTQEGTAERTNGPIPNTRCRSQSFKRKHGIYEPNPRDVIHRLSESDPLRKQKLDQINVQVVQLWPIFDVIFNCNDGSSPDLNNDDVTYDKDDNEDDTADDDGNGFNDDADGNDDYNEKDGRSKHYDNDDDVHDDKNDDNHSEDNSPDDVMDKNEDIDAADENDDIDAYYDNDDNSTCDDDDIMSMENYESVQIMDHADLCDIDDILCSAASVEDTYDCDACQVSFPENISFAVNEEIISSKMLEAVESSECQTYNDILIDVNNNIDDSQLDSNYHNWCQCKHFETGRQNCCHGNPQYPSVGVVGDNISNVDSTALGNNNNSTMGNNAAHNAPNMTDFLDADTEGFNYAHTMTSDNDEDFGINNNNTSDTWDLIYSDSNLNQKLQQDTLETRSETELELDLHTPSTMRLNSSGVISRQPVKTVSNSKVGVERAVGKVTEVCGANCVNFEKSVNPLSTNYSEKRGFITTCDNTTDITLITDKDTVQSQLLSHDHMANHLDKNKNNQVSQLTINVAPVATPTRSSSGKYSTIFQPSGSDVSKEGSTPLKSLKSSQTASGQTRPDPSTECIPSVYTNEIVVHLSSDDLSESDLEENFMPSSHMERLRKVSMGDMRDFADLKVMTEKLNLNHRRPSLVAWKEKNLPKNVVAAKKGQSDTEDENDLQDGDKGHEVESNQTTEEEKDPAGLNQKKRLINQKALTPPTERAHLGDDLQGRPRSSSFKSPSKYSYDYTATIASTRSLESIHNGDKVSNRRGEVSRGVNTLEISEGVKPAVRTGSKAMMSSSSSLPSIREEKVDSSGAIPSELERRRKVDDTIEWIKNELQDMRSLDCTLAKQLLRLREEIHHLRLQRCYEHQKEMIEDAFDREHELSVEKKFDVGDFDLPERLFSPELRQVGITRINITSRRFSVF